VINLPSNVVAGARAAELNETRRRRQRAVGAARTGAALREGLRQTFEDALFGDEDGGVEVAFGALARAGAELGAAVGQEEAGPELGEASQRRVDRVAQDPHGRAAAGFVVGGALAYFSSQADKPKRENGGPSGSARTGSVPGDRHPAHLRG